jgi:hypothetical protein
MDAHWAGDAPRYPAAKTLVVSFPGVDINSVITYTINRKVKNRPFFSKSCRMADETWTPSIV